MKRNYIKPCTLKLKFDTGTNFMTNSLGSNAHEGFVPSADKPVVEDANDDDSPF